MRLFRKLEEFELPAHDGGRARLKDYLRRYLVLYFYPKAGSPGCAREAQEFSARLGEFEALEAAVLGVSPDRPEAQAKFVEAKGLKVRMLSDPELRLARELGAVDGQGKLLRSTFLFDRAGALRWQWLGVKVAGHAEEVLQVLKALHSADREINPLIATRRAWRAISSEPIPEELITRLIEAAHLAPSCFNNQPWRFVVATGEGLEKVKAALPGGNYWTKPAPVIIAVASHRDLDCKLSDGRDYFLFGCGLAVGNLMVQATQMGLVAHPIAGYDPLKVKEALGIPPDYVLMTLVVVGKPGDPGTLSEKHLEIELGPRERKPLEAVLAWGRFAFKQREVPS
ncbi:MAG: redoxin domain-containing protein [Candidatus Acetothermia bacterium]|jgi:peroxiredoxin/nitroreductase|nr:redoxin domain-containing protein [Candidatus Acetothermia bacterium]MDH7505258.1 redoxin domain-containing protein [Candidatus Acetothermia bacterium]